MIDRREVLKSGVALAAIAGLPRAALAQEPGDELSALFDRMFAEQLRLNPEGATQLGLDTGANADLRGLLSDEGPMGRQAARALTARHIARLEAFKTDDLTPEDKRNYDVVLYTKRQQSAAQRFDFGGASYGRSPYVVSQLTGAYQSTPSFLDTKHPIENDADAEAYLARLGQFADQLNANSDDLRDQSARGILPPDFLLDPTIDQLTKTTVPADQAIVVTSLQRRAAAKNLDPRYGARAAQLYGAKVFPALQAQLDLVKALRAKATSDAGVWKIKQGAEFYAVALAGTTTTRMSPEEVHKFGLDEAAAISARLDALLKAQGMTKGGIGERVAALYRDPAQLYPDTDEGKRQAIAYCNDRLAAIRPRLPRAFKRLPQYAFEVRRVPVENEAGAASAYAQPPSLDGKRPGLVYFNLRDSAEWPKFCLATTVFHEGLPGHQFEGGLALSNAKLPLIRKVGGFSGYGEGWALYAEQLADELGMYDDDPLGRIGYLKFQLFRANRCVVDTGIHHFRWTRAQAIARFVEQEGEAPGFAAREVDRYCATPGQACSYKIGHSVFVRLREEAKAKLGPRFTLGDFHEAVLGTGRVPLEILEAETRRWLANA
ncbi:MAG: Tat pathway signal protein [Proteobacteria bacterium SG_bin5]|nr:DUF885 family protein [Sphingomonas sp.]OQW43125.1 MAG: Tat pathway signal protein [Proteobacteria bacterium SG_bin5]